MLCSYWGEALRWGPQHKLDSAEACCEACLAYQPDSEDGMGCNGGSFPFPSAACALTGDASHPAMHAAAERHCMEGICFPAMPHRQASVC